MTENRSGTDRRVKQDRRNLFERRAGRDRRRNKVDVNIDLRYTTERRSGDERRMRLERRILPDRRNLQAI